MLNLILGALTAIAFVGVHSYLGKKGIILKWWGWLLTVLALLYALLTVKSIFGFIGEGFPQAALFIGGILAFIALVWGVIMVRFVYKKA